MPVCQSGLEDQGLASLGGEIVPERSEEPGVTRQLAQQCAELLRQARHAVVYTGAGVSTASGISDYRGPDGVWTCLATGRIPDDSFDWTAAVPSFAHMCIAELMKRKMLKFCTSTNLDALHFKSGLVPLQNLAELHGSKYVERCPDCQREYLRSFPIRRTATRATGRFCECGGALMDSGIDFGQDLPMHHLDLAQQHAAEADFSLVVGSSMRVRPACELPVMTAKALCIVNRMDTGLDDSASIRSYGLADVFFRHLAAELGIQVPAARHCEQLHSATQMRRLAGSLLPPSCGHFVGEEQQERQMAEALASVEGEILSGQRIAI
mmetsp:Transcript_62264/g.144876  ORF Transcript_62264/g.144876 Transcript_62264/m.144876 type:complete len:323 (-) Transcript_62264:59-1027(-)